ncbi:MAG: tetratricopeptide repeat protein [Gallionella sp.]|nr:tetratricopeptide repeat protein [Gallionella sp.]
MSVINQVLNQLEQRGEHTAPEQTMVRPVPHRQPSYILPLLALVLALAGGVGAWQWMQMRKATVVAASARPQPVAPAPAAPVAAEAVGVASAVIVVSAVDAASAVSVTSAVADAGSGDAPPVEILPPASRLSFELAAIPLPSSLRQAAILHDAKSPATPDAGEKLPTHAAPPARATKPQPMQTPSTNVLAASRASPGASPMKQVSSEQRTDAEFRQAVAAMQQGHIADAIAGYRAVLRLDTGHDEARQALVALLLESKQGAEAERVLQERLNAKPGHTGFAMLLARLQVEHDALEQAAATLEKSLPYADAQADYQAFFAALLQRRNRHKEAISHYQIALQLAPDNGVWLMGYGISLQAVQRNEDARNAFRRALESRTLTPELQAFVRQKIKEL